MLTDYPQKIEQVTVAQRSNSNKATV